MGWGGLLELVDHQVLETVGDLEADIGALGEHAVEGEEDVAAVEAARLGEDPVVGRVELGELELTPRGLPGGLVRRLLRLPGPQLQPRRADPFGLQRVDPREQPGQQGGGVAADLVAAQRQLVEPVEQHRQALRGAQHVEERVEAGGLGVLAQEPLADRLPAADPELLERAVQQRLGAFAKSPRRGAGRADHQHPLGCGPRRGEPGQPPRQQLGLAGPGGAEHQQRALSVGDRAIPLVRFDLGRGLFLAHRPTLARHSIRSMDVFSADWLGICRRIVAAQRAIFAATASSEERTVYEGVGEGGDHTLAIDRRCEDAVFAELDSLAAEGASFVAVSEERGEVSFGSGGAARVVIDPIDGSLNARRTIPSHSLSIAVASGSSMADVEFGFVHDFGADEEFVARRGGGAALAGDAARVSVEEEKLEVVGLESAEPEWSLPALEALAGKAYRLRVVGSIAITAAYVASRPLRRDAQPAAVPLGRRRRRAADRPRGRGRGRVRRPRARGCGARPRLPATRSPPPAARPRWRRCAPRRVPPTAV